MEFTLLMFCCFLKEEVMIMLDIGNFVFFDNEDRRENRSLFKIAYFRGHIALDLLYYRVFGFPCWLMEEE